MDSSVACYLLNNEDNVPFLRDIAKQDSSIEKVQHVIHIGLLPNALGRLKTSINNTLNSKLKKYDSELNGILVGYENIALIGTNGALIPGYSNIHVNVQVDCFVFKPQEGGRLSGTVVKKCAASVTCLAHRVFTVFVSVPRHLAPALRIHQRIEFVVDRVDLCSQIPLVKAHLHEDGAFVSSHVRFDAEPDSGLSSVDGSWSVNGLSPSTAADDPPPAQARRASKKRRRSQPESDPERAPSAAADTDTDTGAARPRKKRRKKEKPTLVKTEPMSEDEPVAAEMYLPDAAPPASRQRRRRSRVGETPPAAGAARVKKERSDQDVLDEVLDELLS